MQETSTALYTLKTANILDSGQFVWSEYSFNSLLKTKFLNFESIQVNRFLPREKQPVKLKTILNIYVLDFWQGELLANVDWCDVKTIMLFALVETYDILKIALVALVSLFYIARLERNNQ